MHDAGQDDTVAAVKAVRQAFETISLPAVIDLVPGGIDKGVYSVCALHVHSRCFLSEPWSAWHLWLIGCLLAAMHRTTGASPA
jgi:hypothetical protein